MWLTCAPMTAPVQARSVSPIFFVCCTIKYVVCNCFSVWFQGTTVPLFWVLLPGCFVWGLVEIWQSLSGPPSAGRCHVYCRG